MIHRYHSRLRRWLQCLSSQPPGTRNNYLPRVGLFTFVILVGKETAEPFHGVLSQILFVFLRCLGRPEAEPPASTSGNWGDDGQKLVAQARHLLQKQLDGGRWIKLLRCTARKPSHRDLQHASKRVTTVTTRLFKNHDESTSTARLCRRRTPYASTEAGDGVLVRW